MWCGIICQHSSTLIRTHFNHILTVHCVYVLIIAFDSAFALHSQKNAAWKKKRNMRVEIASMYDICFWFIHFNRRDCLLTAKISTSRYQFCKMRIDSSKELWMSKTFSSHIIIISLRPLRSITAHNIRVRLWVLLNSILSSAHTRYNVNNHFAHVEALKTLEKKIR